MPREQTRADIIVVAWLVADDQLDPLAGVEILRLCCASRATQG
jgi:hypothetical protein